MKTRNVIGGLTSGLRSLAAGIIPAVMTLAAGALLLPGVASAQISSSGNDFIVGFLVNISPSAPIVEFIELHLTSSAGMYVQVEYPVGTNLGTPVELIPGSVKIVSFPSSASSGWPTGAPSLNALRARSVNPSQRFTCYMINRKEYTSDAALALPVDSLGIFYRVIAPEPTLGGTNGSQFVVVATQNGTTVTITPSHNLQSGQPAGIPFNVTLNRGEGWLALGTGKGVTGDLTASTVRSSLPVSVTNGVGCEHIDLGTCDHVFEIAQPVQTWGTGIPTANLPGFPMVGVRYRIMAADNNTTVLQDGASIGILNAGQFLTTPRLMGSHFFDGVEAGNPKPIFVVQFMPGEANGICASGDPSIGNIIPAAQYQAAYTFSTVGGNQFACNFVTIIAATSNVGALTLDSVPVPAGSFTVIGGSGYSSAIVSVSSGVHHTASANPHGLSVEGYNAADSYLYPGGALLNPINGDLVLTKDDQVSTCVRIGGTINYRVCYQNTEKNPANNVAIVDTLPSEENFVSASGGGVYNSGPRTVTWSVATAPANMPSPVCFDLKVTVNNTATVGGEIVNFASIDSDETDPTAIQKRTAVCIPTPTPTPTPAATPNPCPGTIFAENFDGVLAPALPAGWVATNAAGATPLWVTSTTNPDTAPNDAFVDDPGTISDKYLDTPGITISSTSAQVSFRNNFNTQYDPPPNEVFWDGGVLEVSSTNINGGAFTDITDPAVGGSFVSGGYTGPISDDSNNPLAGRMAWSGNSGGYICTVVNLGPNVNGQTIRLRFRMGTDNAMGAPGWRVDMIQVSNGFVCCGPPPTPPACPCIIVVLFASSVGGISFIAACASIVGKARSRSAPPLSAPKAT